MPDPYDLLEGDVLECLQSMPDCSVQCVVTSPPYWGLRNYGVDGAGGLEPTLQEHLAWLVAVFREVRRVMRDDGTCWVNYGDAYSSGASGQSGLADYGKKHGMGGGHSDAIAKTKRGGSGGLAPKQRLLMPARVALALQDDGWWVRSEIVWAKGVSFCPTYSGSCMPSSVKDRPTDSHEMMYLLTKQPRYFYDGDAVREGDGGKAAGNRDVLGKQQARATSGAMPPGGQNSAAWEPGAGRNIRTVWTINPQPFPEAHFATFPEALVRPCILAGTSEHGACSECGAPWERVVEAKGGSIGEGGWEQGAGDGHVATNRKDSGRDLSDYSRTTTGWQPTCSCRGHFVKAPINPDDPDSRVHDVYVPDIPLSEHKTRPCKVLDPFSGSGTTGVVALRHGRHYVGCELNPDYCDMQEERLEAERAALRWADGVIFDGRRFLNGAQPITQKALRAATKKQGISGRRFRELLDDARADYAQHASPPVADAGGGDA